MNPADSLSMRPASLHLLIAANNPEGVAANLGSKGVVGVSEQSQPSDLVRAAYSLEKEGEFEQFVSDLAYVFHVPLNESGANAETLKEVLANSLSSLVVSNALANPQENHILVPEQEYEQLRIFASWCFVAACVLGGILLIKIIFRR